MHIQRTGPLGDCSSRTGQGASSGVRPYQKRLL